MTCFRSNQENLIGMKKCRVLLFGCLSFISSLNLFSQLQTVDSLFVDTVKLEKKPQYDWKNLADGLSICETDAPIKSTINDSKLTIVKIDPSKFDFFLLTATEYEKRSRTVKEWADTFDLNIALNAGMYDLSNGLINRGFMKNYQHCNNPNFNPAYNSMIALNPVDTLDSRFAILDLKCDSWENVKGDYHCFAQGMRMIDCNGTALGWNKRNQSCSMLVAASDPYGNIYYIFSRSPYTHNQIIGFMTAMPFELTNAIYLEGGPETSLYIKVGNTVIEKFGSYVSGTYPNDDNDHFWALPNVIGMKLKKLKN